MLGFEGRVLVRSNVTGVERYAREIYGYLKSRTDVALFLPASGNKYYSHVWTHLILPIRVALSGSKTLFCPVMDAPTILPRDLRLVVTIPDLAFLRNPDMYSYMFRTYYRLVLPKIAERADKIICISNSERLFIEEMYPITQGKTEVIYPGISHEFSDTGLARGKVILSVASFNKHKNLVRMLLAFEQIMDEIPHTLVLVGGDRAVISSDDEVGPVLERLERSGRVMRTGYIGDEQLHELYRTSEIFVFPSLFEGFGFPPLEAMASGCAVCASGVSSMPEVCGGAADYFDPLSVDSIATSIKKLADNEVYRQQLAAKGKEHVKKYTWGSAGEKTLQVLLKDGA